MAETNTKYKQSSLKNDANGGYYQQWRMIKDSLARYGVVAGGLGVILAIVLIFFYLLYVVFPLFTSANAEPVSQYEVPEKNLGNTLLLAMEEQNEVAVRFTDSGQAVFFAAATGKTIAIKPLGIPEGVQVTSFAQGNPVRGDVIYGLSNGAAIVARQKYDVSYPNDVRLITPSLVYPLGEAPLLLDDSAAPLEKVALKAD